VLFYLPTYMMSGFESDIIPGHRRDPAIRHEPYRSELGRPIYIQPRPLAGRVRRKARRGPRRTACDAVIQRGAPKLYWKEVSLSPKLTDTTVNFE